MQCESTAAEVLFERFPHRNSAADSKVINAFQLVPCERSDA